MLKRKNQQFAFICRLVLFTFLIKYMLISSFYSPIRSKIICHCERVRVGNTSKFVVRTLHIPEDIWPERSPKRAKLKPDGVFTGFFWNSFVMESWSSVLFKVRSISALISSDFSLRLFWDGRNNLKSSIIGLVKTSRLIIRAERRNRPVMRLQ